MGADYRIALDRVREALVVSSYLSDATRQTGLRMTWYVNQDEFHETGQLRCWPSVETLATELCLTPRAIEQGRKRLIEVGALEVVKKGGRGPRDPSIYALSLEWADNELNEMKDRLSDAREAKRANRHSPLDGSDRAAVRANAGAVKGERQSQEGRTMASIRANQRSPDSCDDSLDNNLVTNTHCASGAAFGKANEVKRSGESSNDQTKDCAFDLLGEKEKRHIQQVLHTHLGGKEAGRWSVIRELSEAELERLNDVTLSHLGAREIASGAYDRVRAKQAQAREGTE